MVALQAMHAIIITVGSELVGGDTLNTNAPWLSRRLAELGWEVVEHRTVGDDRERLARHIRHCLAQAGLVVITGGLGPTADDLTREAIADALGVELIEDADALARIETFFQSRGRAMAASNRRQALVPAGCQSVANPMGTAPGIRGERHGVRLVALPGVPSEMEAMFRDAIAPMAAGVAHGAIRSRMVRTYGMSEARVGELLFELMARDRNPLVGTLAQSGIISVRLTVRGRDAAEADHLLDHDIAVIRERLGDAVFGMDEDTLSAVTGRLLLANSTRLAVAESCTGGMLAKLLTDVPGSSDYFQAGYVTYANEAKRDVLGVPGRLMEKVGAVSAEVAEAMALGCLRISGADYAISVTGIAGPGGGQPPAKPVGLVYVGLADSSGCFVRRYLMGDTLLRGEIRARTCHAALNLLRLRLLGVAPPGGSAR